MGTMRSGREGKIVKNNTTSPENENQRYGAPVMRGESESTLQVSFLSVDTPTETAGEGISTHTTGLLKGLECHVLFDCGRVKRFWGQRGGIDKNGRQLMRCPILVMNIRSHRG